MHASLILLPGAAYSLLTLIFCRRAGVREISEALVKGHIVLFAFIAVSTEMLSAFHAISFTALVIGWFLFLSVCFVAAALLIHRRRQGWTLPVLRRVTPLAVLLVGVIAFILATTFATAILYPPNTWDSMTYHMPRVVHWISNNSVSFYPTAIPRQTYQMPLAEFAIMHVQILSGGDLFANLVQWVSFLVLICLGLLIAAELGLSNRQQLLSAVVIATLPMAILQASSTQNDLVVSSFVMSFSLFMLRIRKNLNTENLLFAATGLGLALLTKGTAFLYCAAIGTSLSVPILATSMSDHASLLKATAALALIVLVALLLNAGHFSRNYHLYGHPVSTADEHYQNGDMSVATLVSNIVRNGALHLGTPSSHINQYLYRALQVALGSQLDNPKTTWFGTSFNVPYSRHEDTAGNLIHMFIVLMSIMLLPILWGQRYHTGAIWYAISVMLGAIFYCWILKWQPWASRLHTPLFAMAAPLLVMTITSDIGGIRKSIGYAILSCMVIYSLPFALHNQSRSLVSLQWNRKDRMELYFQNRAHLLHDYIDAMNIVEKAGVREVGLYLDRGDWEYPFWVVALQKEKNGRTISFRHVGVSNVSRMLEEDTFLPLYVIATKKIVNWEYATMYASVFTSDSVSVFKTQKTTPH